MELSVKAIKVENIKRKENLFLARFNPVTGEGAGGKRFSCIIKDYLNGKQIFLPVEMLEKENNVSRIIQCGSFSDFALTYFGTNEENIVNLIFEDFEYLRCKYDFPYFCYAYVKIKNKNGGQDFAFFLRPAQRKLVRTLEMQRLSGKPLRIILLKSRQWGGSTCIEVYMGWLQLFWKLSWNSLIVGHQTGSAVTSKDMYTKLLDNLPAFLLRGVDAVGKSNIVSGGTPNISVIPVRNCKITTVSAVNPESARGGDVAMCHCTEVAFWPDTEKMTPQQLVKAACSGITLSPYTFIAYESTPNGMSNFFHDEWTRAHNVDDYGNRISEFEPVFVPWFEIETYIMPIKNEDAFVETLLNRRNDTRGNGAYLFWLWNIGATLEGINWYEHMLKRYESHEDMKQEYPSNDIEGFRTTGNMVFDIYKLEEMSKATYINSPQFTGEIYGEAPKGNKAITGLSLSRSAGGRFRIWEYPDNDKAKKYKNAYFVAVDIGGRKSTSDFTCITVFDRTPLAKGEPQRVVAEWYGHDDPDLLAIKCAQISKYYCDALLIVERNTPDSRMNDTDGDVTELFFPILIPLYTNIYCDNGSEANMQPDIPRKYGFQTNRSTKPAIILNYCRVIREDLYIEPDKETISELSYYLKYPNGKYGAAAGRHDDKVMSRGIGLFISLIKQQEYPVEERKQINFSHLNKLNAVRYLN